MPVWTRRAVALLFVPGLIVAIAVAMAMPILGMARSQARWRDDAATTLAAAKHAPAVAAELAQQIAATKGSELWSRFYAGNGSMSSATSLHGDISSLLAQAEASAQSLSPIPAQELPLFSKIGIRCMASMRVNHLQRFMAALARHPRYLRIEHLVVVAPQLQNAEENPPLAVTMDIFGFERDVERIRAPAERPSLALRGAR
jgi:hypothetical protein